MGLVNPNALWLLLLLIPLILAWKRRPRTTRSVGNMFLWQQAASSTSASFAARLRRNWLLAAQIAFVLAAVLALARPVLPFRDRSVAFVLDLSASMGAREGAGTRLDAAIARAEATLESLAWNARVRLIASRSVADEIGEYRRSDPALRRALRVQKPTAGPADVEAAIEAARAGGVAPGDIHVFSDGPPAASVRWVRVGTPAANAAITNVAARRLPLAPAAGQVLIEAWNYGADALNAEIELAANGRPIGSHAVRLAPGNRTSLLVEAPAVDGVIAARLISDDALSVDNVRFAVMESIQPVRVRLTGSSFFIEKALYANRTLVVDGSRGHEPDVIVCSGCSQLPPGPESVLLVPPAAQPAPNAGVMTLSAPYHPIARAVDLSGILAVPVAHPAEIEMSAGDSNVLARIAGRPAVLANEVNGRRSVLLLLDATDPRLALSSAFPILIANAIDWLARRGENARELMAGEPLNWMLPGPPKVRPEVIDPSGRALPSFLAGSRVTSSATHAAGVYVIRADRDETFVVNPATFSESDLRAQNQAAPSPASVAPPPAPSSLGRETVAPLILLALGLAAVEWWLRSAAARRV